MIINFFFTVKPAHGRFINAIIGIVFGFLLLISFGSEPITLRIAAYSCINVQDFKSRAQSVLGIYVTRHVRVRKYKRNPHVTHTHTHTHTYTHTHSHTYYTVVHTSHIILYIHELPLLRTTICRTYICVYEELEFVACHI